MENKSIKILFMDNGGVGLPGLTLQKFMTWRVLVDQQAQNYRTLKKKKKKKRGPQLPYKANSHLCG